MTAAGPGGGPGQEILLYEWLNLLVFHMARQRLLFSACDVREEPDGRWCAQSVPDV